MFDTDRLAQRVSAAVLSVATALYANDTIAEWKAGPDPELLQGIVVDYYAAPSNDPCKPKLLSIIKDKEITAPKGHTPTFKVFAIDKDINELPETTETDCQNVSGNTKWTSSYSGAFGGPSEVFGSVVTINLKPIPSGQDQTTFTLTAKASDGDDSSRYDENGGSSDTITIRVVKVEPSSLAVETECKHSFDDSFWCSNVAVRGIGATLYRYELSGNPKPNPPNNWNGWMVAEEITPKPNDGTLEASHLNVPALYEEWNHTPYSRFAVCKDQAISDELGPPPFNNFGCDKAAISSSFLDLVASGANSAEPQALAALKDGVGDKTFKKDQSFFTFGCDGDTISLLDQTITRTLSNVDVTCDFPIGAIKRTNISHDK